MSTTGCWTPEEDRLLAEWQAKVGNKWSLVAAHIPGRTGQQCAQRWRHKVNPQIKREKWTREEDHKLAELVAQHGNKWAIIARHCPGRTDQQCMGRWRRHLDPSIRRDSWSKEEDRKLVQLFKQFNSQWSHISKHVVGRTAQQCRARWFQVQAKEADSPAEHAYVNQNRPRSQGTSKKQKEATGKQVAAMARKLLKAGGPDTLPPKQYNRRTGSDDGWEEMHGGAGTAADAASIEEPSGSAVGDDDGQRSGGAGAVGGEGYRSGEGCLGSDGSSSGGDSHVAGDGVRDRRDARAAAHSAVHGGDGGGGGGGGAGGGGATSHSTASPRRSARRASVSKPWRYRSGAGGRGSDEEQSSSSQEDSDTPDRSLLWQQQQQRRQQRARGPRRGQEAKRTRVETKRVPEEEEEEEREGGSQMRQWGSRRSRPPLDEGEQAVARGRRWRSTMQRRRRSGRASHSHQEREEEEEGEEEGEGSGRGQVEACGKDFSLLLEAALMESSMECSHAAGLPVASPNAAGVSAGSTGGGSPGALRLASTPDDGGAAAEEQQGSDPAPECWHTLWRKAEHRAFEEVKRHGVVEELGCSSPAASPRPAPRVRRPTAFLKWMSCQEGSHSGDGAAAAGASGTSSMQGGGWAERDGVNAPNTPISKACGAAAQPTGPTSTPDHTSRCGIVKQAMAAAAASAAAAPDRNLLSPSAVVRTPERSQPSMANRSPAMQRRCEAGNGLGAARRLRMEAAAFGADSDGLAGSVLKREAELASALLHSGTATLPSSGPGPGEGGGDARSKRARLAQIDGQPLVASGNRTDAEVLSQLGLAWQPSRSSDATPRGSAVGTSTDGMPSASAAAAASLPPFLGCAGSDASTAVRASALITARRCLDTLVGSL